MQQDGQQFVLVRDHLGLSPEGTALGIPLYQFMTLVDGSRSIQELQTIFMRQQGGVLVSSEEILGLLNNLDAVYLLDSENFQTAKHQIVDDFTRKRIRPPAHSGKSYPANSEALNALLAEIMAEPSVPLSNASTPSRKIRALVAPHNEIDLGRKSYAQT